MIIIRVLYLIFIFGDKYYVVQITSISNSELNKRHEIYSQITIINKCTE